MGAVARFFERFAVVRVYTCVLTKTMLTGFVVLPTCFLWLTLGQSMMLYVLWHLSVLINTYIHNTHSNCWLFSRIGLVHFATTYP